MGRPNLNLAPLAHHFQFEFQSAWRRIRDCACRGAEGQHDTANALVSVSVSFDDLYFVALMFHVIVVVVD